MPIGSWSAYTQVIRGMLATNPTSVLDLGIGFGMNGAAVRNWLDLGVKPFLTKLVGVEAWNDYKNPTWDLYDEVIIGDLVQVVNRLPDFDMIIMTDVIEHLPKGVGLELLDKLKSKANKSVLVSTPGVWIEQGAAYGNEYETHRSMWTCSDFIDKGYGIVDDGKGDAYGHMMIVADYIKK